MNHDQDYFRIAILSSHSRRSDQSLFQQAKVCYYATIASVVGLSGIQAQTVH